MFSQGFEIEREQFIPQRILQASKSADEGFHSFGLVYVFGEIARTRRGERLVEYALVGGVEVLLLALDDTREKPQTFQLLGPGLHRSRPSFSAA